MPPTLQRKGSKRTTLSQKADLVLPVSRIKRFMEEDLIGGKGTVVRKDAAVMFTAILEYMMADVLDGTTERMKDKKTESKRLNNVHLNKNKLNDEENTELFDNTIITGAPKQFNIHPELMRKRNKKKKKTVTS